jgi:hypothetical protein
MTTLSLVNALNIYIYIYLFIFKNYILTLIYQNNKKNKRINPSKNKMTTLSLVCVYIYLFIFKIIF